MAQLYVAFALSAIESPISPGEGPEVARLGMALCLIQYKDI